MSPSRRYDAVHQHSPTNDNDNDNDDDNDSPNTSQFLSESVNAGDSFAGGRGAAAGSAAPHQGMSMAMGSLGGDGGGGGDEPSVFDLLSVSDEPSNSQAQQSLELLASHTDMMNRLEAGLVAKISGGSNSGSNSGSNTGSNSDSDGGAGSGQGSAKANSLGPSAERVGSGDGGGAADSDGARGRRATYGVVGKSGTATSGASNASGASASASSDAVGLTTQYFNTSSVPKAGAKRTGSASSNASINRANEEADYDGGSSGDNTEGGGGGAPALAQYEYTAPTNTRDRPVLNPPSPAEWFSACCCSSRLNLRHGGRTCAWPHATFCVVSPLLLWCD